MARTTRTLVAVALALSACSSVTLQASHDAQIPAGVLSTFTYAAAGRDTKTVIVGNPFSLPKADVDRAVIDAMQGHNEGPATRFTADPSETIRPGYPIVMVFNPPPSMTQADLCRHISELRSRPSEESLRLLAGFCAQDKLLSWVNASIPRVDSPSDPAFRQMIAETTRNLIPDRDDDQGNGAMDL